MFDMINIFEVFLPQLLRYPNPTDPLNGEAAALMIREPKSYDAKVKGIVGVSCFSPRPSCSNTEIIQSTFKSMRVKKRPMKRGPRVCAFAVSIGLVG